VGVAVLALPCSTRLLPPDYFFFQSLCRMKNNYYICTEINNLICNNVTVLTVNFQLSTINSIMATFFNHNQILGVQLIPANALMWKVGDYLVPFERVFHWQAIRQLKQVTIAYRQNNTYKSLLDDTDITNDSQTGKPKLDAVITANPIPLILDTEDITFKSSADKQRAGTLYNNKLTYSLQRMESEEYAQAEQQLAQLQSGQAFHLLFSLYSCEAAKSIVLCPEPCFSAAVDDSLSNTQITIDIKNLTAHQYLK